jgi:F0F1-type ATP synthase membrane subunit c/vacuolar-type H+-ATPase subunit K
MQNIVIILIMLLSTLGPAAVIALVGYSAVKSVGRNPSASPKIFLVMIIAFIFAESIAILALLVTFQLFFK